MARRRRYMDGTPIVGDQDGHKISTDAIVPPEGTAVVAHFEAGQPVEIEIMRPIWGPATIARGSRRKAIRVEEPPGLAWFLRHGWTLED